MDQAEAGRLGLPGEGALRSLVEGAAVLVAQAAPLSTALLGADPGLPELDAGRGAAALASMATVRDDLEGLGPLPVSADEGDRLALRAALGRAVAAFRPGDPSGPAALEQHLQVRLLRLLDGPDGVGSLVEFVEFGPEFLRRCRPPLAGGSAAAADLAVAAAGRIPLLLDAAAAAGREMAKGPSRFRLEAALGLLLQAGAEESGWLLREYRPQAVEPQVPSIPPEALRLGLGMTLEELEGEAEAALTDAVLAPGPSAEEPGAPAGLEDARHAWEEGPAAGVDLEFALTPAWLQPLVAGLSLVLPGPLSRGPARLLLTEGGPTTAADVAIALECEFLPWARQRGRARLARVLLPAPDTGEGWRAHVRGSGGLLSGGWPRELAWRSALALAAIAMSVRGATVEQAIGLVAAESGLPEDTVRLQCLHLSRQPLAALTFIAGRAAVRSALARVGDAALLAEGPLPAEALARLAQPDGNRPPYGL